MKKEAARRTGKVTTEKAQAETGIVRVTKDEVVKSTTSPVKPMAEVKPVEITNPKAPEPIKLAEQKPQPARVASPDGKPELLKKPRGGKADDLKLIWGVGPKLETDAERHGHLALRPGRVVDGQGTGLGRRAPRRLQGPRQARRLGEAIEETCHRLAPRKCRRRQATKKK